MSKMGIKDSGIFAFCMQIQSFLDFREIPGSAILESPSLQSGILDRVTKFFFPVGLKRTWEEN